MGFHKTADELKHISDLQHSALSSLVQETTKIKLPSSPLYDVPTAFSLHLGLVLRNLTVHTGCEMWSSLAVGQGSLRALDAQQCFRHCESCRWLAACSGPSCVH